MRFELDVVAGPRLLHNMVEVTLPAALQPEVERLELGTMIEGTCTRDAAGVLQLEKIEIITRPPDGGARRAAWYARRKLIPLALEALDDATVAADDDARALRAHLRSICGQRDALEDLDVLLERQALSVPAGAPHGLWEIAGALEKAGIAMTPERSARLEAAYARQLARTPDVLEHPRFSCWLDYDFHYHFLKETPLEQRPPGPFLLDGGRVAIARQGKEAIAKWCVEQVRAWATKDTDELELILATLSEYSAQPSELLLGRLREAADRPRRAVNAIAIARLAASAVVSGDEMMGNPYSAAVTRTVALARTAPKRKDLAAPTLQQLLLGFDRQLVHWDFRAAVKAHAGIDVADAEVLYRPSKDREGTVALWLTRTPRGLGLLVNLGSWQWLEADAQTVMATIPSEYFAGAARAARQSDETQRGR